MEYSVGAISDITLSFLKGLKTKTYLKLNLLFVPPFTFEILRLLIDMSSWFSCFFGFFSFCSFLNPHYLQGISTIYICIYSSFLPNLFTSIENFHCLLRIKSQLSTLASISSTILTIYITQLSHNTLLPVSPFKDVLLSNTVILQNQMGSSISTKTSLTSRPQPIPVILVVCITFSCLQTSSPYADYEILTGSVFCLGVTTLC